MPDPGQKASGSPYPAGPVDETKGDLPRWDTDRVEAFSDGVFAIAITLLVLTFAL